MVEVYASLGAHWCSLTLLFKIALQPTPAVPFMLAGVCIHRNVMSLYFSQKVNFNMRGVLSLKFLTPNCKVNNVH